MIQFMDNMLKNKYISCHIHLHTTENITFGEITMSKS